MGAETRGPRGRIGLTTPCFNEAAPRWARKLVVVRAERAVVEVASMRPRHDGRGNDHVARDERRYVQASMRPRHDGRGNGALLRYFLGRVAASMRPRHDGRGNMPSSPVRPTTAASFNEAAPRWARKPRSASRWESPAKI